MPKKPPETLGIIYRMPLEDLHPHPLNPYGVQDDSAMRELMESVKENGVLIPAIARPRKEGGYELISGHRRKYACEQLGQDTM
ncbi:MAG: ParB N-terminal domain-containing protein, partial [Neglectibacter timonensis]